MEQYNNAPRKFRLKNPIKEKRAVTAEDYKAIIESNYPLVESVSVWGGEENNPPLYGKVIISLKPYLGYTISNELKTRIINYKNAELKTLL